MKVQNQLYRRVIGTRPGARACAYDGDCLKMHFPTKLDIAYLEEVSHWLDKKCLIPCQLKPKNSFVCSAGQGEQEKTNASSNGLLSTYKRLSSTKQSPDTTGLKFKTSYRPLKEKDNKDKIEKTQTSNFKTK